MVQGGAVLWSVEKYYAPAYVMLLLMLVAVRGCEFDRLRQGGVDLGPFTGPWLTLFFFLSLLFGSFPVRTRKAEGSELKILSCPLSPSLSLSLFLFLFTCLSCRHVVWSVFKLDTFLPIHASLSPLLTPLFFPFTLYLSRQLLVAFVCLPKQSGHADPSALVRLSYSNRPPGCSSHPFAWHGCLRTSAAVRETGFE